MRHVVRGERAAAMIGEREDGLLARAALGRDAASIEALAAAKEHEPEDEAQDRDRNAERVAREARGKERLRDEADDDRDQEPGEEDDPPERARDRAADLRRLPHHVDRRARERRTRR